MTAIAPSTHRRLKKLPQIPSVWEGDRRHVDRLVEELDLDSEDGKQELIVWVDGVEGVVRSMEAIDPRMGTEAIVRALIKAMEYPQSPAQPARPQKIIVRDRQLQFYLRGVLQDLEITIEYVPELPIIDELFDRFSDMAGTRAPRVQRKYIELLKATAREIWDLAPWSMLADYEAISIELNQWDIDKFYVSVMGMLGMEYGVLLYRSADSLRRFRAMALDGDEGRDMESAFLSQDCIFITFDGNNSGFDEDLGDLPATAIEPSFGNIHPMEGMRPFLYEEEAIATQIALVALKAFIKAFKRELQAEKLPSLSKRVTLTTPDTQTILNVTVESLPELSEELLQMHLDVGGEDDFDSSELPIQDDLIPEDSFISLGIMPWTQVEILRSKVGYHQASEVTTAGEGLPVLLIQTTRTKAQEIIQRIAQAGGLKGICFDSEQDPDGFSLDLGILELADGEMQLFGEFYNDTSTDTDDRQQWSKLSQANQGCCGLIIANGLTGKARGNPGVRETLAFLETKSLSSSERPTVTIL